jgi:hypothetical protein
MKTLVMPVIEKPADTAARPNAATSATAMTEAVTGAYAHTYFGGMIQMDHDNPTRLTKSIPPGIFGCNRLWIAGEHRVTKLVATECTQ